MNRKHAFVILALALLLPALTMGSAFLRRATPAVAQTSPSYNLEWHVIGGGGQPAASTNYLVNSTAGQGAASPPYSASGHYVVSGGYWFTQVFKVYLPLVLRAYP